MFQLYKRAMRWESLSVAALPPKNVNCFYECNVSGFCFRLWLWNQREDFEVNPDLWPSNLIVSSMHKIKCDVQSVQNPNLNWFKS